MPNASRLPASPCLITDIQCFYALLACKRERTSILAPSSSHIAREMLTYCHAPAHSCSRAIPCEDRALAIRGFPRPAPRREGCKGFYRADPSPTLPSMGGGSYNRQHRASPSPHRGGMPEGQRGSARVQRTDGTDLVINAPSVHIISLYLALSRSILQGAKFVQYICKRKRKFPSFKFQVFPIMRAP